MACPQSNMARSRRSRRRPSGSTSVAASPWSPCIAVSYSTCRCRSTRSRILSSSTYPMTETASISASCSRRPTCPISAIRVFASSRRRTDSRARSLFFRAPPSFARRLAGRFAGLRHAPYRSRRRMRAAKRFRSSEPSGSSGLRLAARSSSTPSPIRRVSSLRSASPFGQAMSPSSMSRRRSSRVCRSTMSVLAACRPCITSRRQALAALPTTTGPASTRRWASKCSAAMQNGCGGR